MPLCNENSAARNAYIGDLARTPFCAEKKITGPIYFDALPEQDLFSRSDSATCHEIADGAASGRARSRIFSTVELHACAKSGRLFAGWAEHKKPARTSRPKPFGGLALFHVEAG